MSRLEFSEQGLKILEHEKKWVAKEVSQFSGKSPTSASLLSAACHLLNQRARYFAVTGEHFSVQELEGLLLIDALDEYLLKQLHHMVKAFIDNRRSKPNSEILDYLENRFVRVLRDLPRYPVGYRTIFTIRQLFELFQQDVENGAQYELAELEHAFVHHVFYITNGYIDTRETPGKRHFSDVAREYDVVTRLKCTCGKDRLKVQVQTLVRVKDGAPYDRLELQCRECAHQRSITFDLPHFQDLYMV